MFGKVLQSQSAWQLVTSWISIGVYFQTSEGKSVIIYTQLIRSSKKSYEQIMPEQYISQAPKKTLKFCSSLRYLVNLAFFRKYSDQRSAERKKKLKCHYTVDYFKSIERLFLGPMNELLFIDPLKERLIVCVLEERNKNKKTNPLYPIQIERQVAIIGSRAFTVS